MLRLNKQQGFTMTELMVAMAIGLIGTIIIFRTFAHSSAINENTSSVSDAVQNGSIGLYTLVRDARNAGYGLNADALLGCTTNAYNEDLPSAAKDYSFLLSPVNIVKGTDTSSDTISFTYSRISNILPAKLAIDYDGSEADLSLSTRYGLEAGTLILLSEPGKACTIRQVSALASIAGDNTISHKTGSYTDVNGVTETIKFNKPGGAGIVYKTGSFVYNIGTSPQNNEYTVVDNKLVVKNRLIGTQEKVVVPDIVLLKASYGVVDAAGNLTFTDTTPVALPDWKNTTTLKIVLVARSRTPDYSKGSGTACNITTGPLPWSGGTLDVSSSSTNWKCYRYRVLETNILLRNLIWTPP